MNLGIVVPCYNEQAVLPETCARLLSLLEMLRQKGKVSGESKLWFVDDGSQDETWRMLESMARRDGRVKAIKLSRNRGHQNALLAGLLTAEGDVLVSIDADLQDDIAVLEDMLDKFGGGSEIVYGVRKSRNTDSFAKRLTAVAFYRLMHLLGARSIFNHADYRLMSRRAIEALREFREVNLFLRGIVPLIGLNSAVVYYDRHERFAGETKYPLRKMVGLALNAITSFSVTPLRNITAIGFLIFAGSMVTSAWVLWVRIFSDTAVPGWASTVLPMYFLGGIQILCLGVIGEYLGKLYSETKARPRYIVERIG